MKKIIVVAGATGNLGSRIVKELLEKGAEVRIIVRQSSDPEQVSKLEGLGAKVFIVDMSSVEALTPVCRGASCIVSALAGLSDVIIDTQKTLLDAAIAAGVPRFIPSDYSLDFTPFSDGENRNLDWRRDFHAYLDTSAIAATTIFNGAFADMLTGQMPLILFKQNRVLYWGDADHRMVFTTIADTAMYTANVALDPSTPRFLRIAGDQLSPREINAVVGEVAGKRFRLFRAGSPGLLSILIKIARFIAPGEAETYPTYQGMQYMRNMVDARSKLGQIDKDRYPNMHWTNVRELLMAHYEREKPTKQ